MSLRDAKRMNNGLRLAALLPALFLGACQVRTDVYGRTVMSTPTFGQVLGMSARLPGPGVPGVFNAAASAPAGDQQTVHGHTVQVVQVGPTDHEILIDGRRVARDPESSYVAIQSGYEGAGRAYVLLAEASGGTACPSMYQAIDLSGSVPLVSAQFGNCSDVFRASVFSGALRVAFPHFRAARPATYVFRDGRLSH